MAIETEYRIVIEPESEPDLSWLDQWNTAETYLGNECLRADGSIMPFSEYVSTVGDPDNHYMYCILIQKRIYEDDGYPSSDEGWITVASLGNIDCLEACHDNIYPEPRFIREPYLRAEAKWMFERAKHEG